MLTVGAIVCVVAVALGVGISRLWSSDGPMAGLEVPKAWYTVDDGKTWFLGPGNKVVPFEHEGKMAVRCFVYTCDGGKTKFASHVERLDPAVRSKYGPQAEVEPWKLPRGAKQVKRSLTGDSGWISEESPQVGQVAIPRCPDGKGNLEAVLP
jgi:hypothetical protein